MRIKALALHTISNNNNISFNGLLTVKFKKPSANLKSENIVRLCTIGDNQLVKVVNKYLPQNKVQIAFSDKWDRKALVIKIKNKEVIKDVLKIVYDETKYDLPYGLRRIFIGTKAIPTSLTYTLPKFDYADLYSLKNLKNIFKVLKFKNNVIRTAHNESEKQWLSSYFSS